jgi:hypothetical protein
MHPTHQVFNQAAVKAGEDMPASWRESLWRMYKSSSQTVRVAVYGAKHDPSNFETLLQDMGDITKQVGGGGRAHAYSEHTLWFDQDKCLCRHEV